MLLGSFDRWIAIHQDICAVGITNQRETCVVWDRHTGEPLHNAIGMLEFMPATRDRLYLKRSACVHIIVWNDSRNVDTCKALVERAGGDAKVFQKVMWTIRSTRRPHTRQPSE